MTRRLDIKMLNKVIDLAMKNQIKTVKIYKPTNGKNKGHHMISFTFNKKVISNNVVTETHRNFLRVAKEVKDHVVNKTYASISLDYVEDAEMLTYRIVENNVE